MTTVLLHSQRSLQPYFQPQQATVFREAALKEDCILTADRVSSMLVNRVKHVAAEETDISLRSRCGAKSRANTVLTFVG